MILTILDARAVQEYVFGSNRLRDNVGASELVDAALERWPLEIAGDFFGSRVNPAPGGALDPSRSILRDPDVDAELLYAGGGNAAFLFREIEQAKAFATEYSARLLVDAPGLQVACVHHPVARGLAGALEDALVELAQHKSAPPLDLRLLGLGVTLPCAVTRGPASELSRPGEEDDEQPVSREVAAKRTPATLRRARERIREHVPRLAERIERDGRDLGAVEFPLQFNDLGRSTGETSYIGVIHLDGNGMGDKFAALISRSVHQGSDADFIRELRRLSEAVGAAGKAAVRAATDLVLDSLHWKPESEGPTVADAVPLRKANGSWALPLRFLVYGGDDITLVCDGRLALDIAARMLAAFSGSTAPLPQGVERLSACAGVAIVKTGHPFAQAYAMADALCRSAKGFRRGMPDAPEACVLDWMLMAGGVTTDIDVIRRRQYRTPGGASLTLRPYVVTSAPGAAIPPGRDWSWLRREILDALKAPDGAWAERRTQLKGSLVPALRGGETATEAELTRLRIRFADLRLPGAEGWNLTGFRGGETPYLDAVELLDLVPHSSDWT